MLNAQRKVASVAAAATLVAAVGLGILVTSKPPVPYQACQALLAHYPDNVGGDHARRLDPGLWELLNPDCTTQTTHGPDERSKLGETPEETAGTSSTSTTTLQAAGKPVCATDNAFELLYLVPSGTTDNSATGIPSWRNTVLQADGKLSLESTNIMGAGQQSHYKTVCDATGAPKVTKVLMSAANNATFSTITTELRNKGWNFASRKYWVFWAGTTSSGFSGQANVNTDSSDSASNSHMSGNMFAVSYNTFSWSTAMHESFHNLGAVQDDAPDSSGGKHCDGDKATGGVMCYQDGGATWDNIQACGNPPTGTAQNTNLDWCSNDFWAPQHRSDATYVGTHWNVAECATGPSGGKWLVATWCGWSPTPTPSPTATATTTPPATFAVYDTTLGAPKCATVQAVCDTGPSLVNGRDSMSGGLEPHQPNTVDTCTDGTVGSYHFDESLDALKVATADGTGFAPGKSVTVTATVYAYGANNFLDVWSAPNVSSPVWSLAATVQAPGSGVRTLTATFTLPSGTGTVQAVRGSFRDSNSSPSAVPCTPGGYDDADDVAFAVGTGPSPTPTPTPTATTTVTPSPTPTPTVGAPQCSDGIDNDGDGTVDAADVECKEDPNGIGSYVYDPNNNSENVHYGAWTVLGVAGQCTVPKLGIHDHETTTTVCSAHE